MYMCILVQCNFITYTGLFSYSPIEDWILLGIQTVGIGHQSADQSCFWAALFSPLAAR